VRLTQRLLIGSVLIVGTLVTIMVTVVDRQLRARLLDQASVTLTHEATLIAQAWRAGLDPDSLADAAGAALVTRVTLIDRSGLVVGDSEFDGEALRALGSHAARPEVLRPAPRGGSARRVSESTGRDELYVAVEAEAGFARVSIPTSQLDPIVRASQRDVVITGLVALLSALLVAWLFSRAVSQPIEQLRDVAIAMARGNLSRRPGLTAPGEVGELAGALHQLGDQLSHRIEALRHEEALVGQLTESLNEGVFAVAANGAVVRINGRARALLGVQDPLPFPVGRLPDDAALKGAIGQGLMGTSTDGMETDVQGVTTRLTARALEDGGVVVALFDLSPIRRVEAVRRDFVANVSHELRTPLTIVSGFAEAIAGDDPPVEVRQQFAAGILRNTQRMQRIVDDLLDLSRIESGGWTPMPVSIDLRDCANEAVLEASAVAAAKGVRLTVDIAPNARSVFADATAVRQIIGNLVDNAIRYTPADGQVIAYSRRVMQGIEIGVRDTGAGIAPEHLPRIFERFYRADAGRSRAEGGTGLGLAIVRHMVEAHGGTVRAESVVGVGTTIAGIFPEDGVTRV
jgi:two-component system, OmpR family, phosphate regulon sensor histidine kinase PhoR